jgi:hypothetical protein
MRQHPDDFHDEDLDRDPEAEQDPEELGTPVYQGTGLSVRALTAEELQRFLAAWTRSLVWRAPLVAAAGLVAQVLAAQAGLRWAGLVGLAAAVLVAWRLRFRPSEQARTWQRGAHGERRTARLLDRLTRDGFVVFHDLALPGSPANVDHLVIGPSGVFAIDSKQWTGSVHQGADGLAWHNHYRLDRTLETVRWEAETVGRLLCTRARRPYPRRRPARPRRGDRARPPAALRARLRPRAVRHRRASAGHHRLDQPPTGRLTGPSWTATGQQPGPADRRFGTGVDRLQAEAAESLAGLLCSGGWVVACRGERRWVG